MEEKKWRDLVKRGRRWREREREETKRERERERERERDSWKKEREIKGCMKLKKKIKLSTKRTYLHIRQ